MINIKGENMKTPKSLHIAGLAVTTAITLSACGPQGTPVVQTVVVQAPPVIQTVIVPGPAAPQATAAPAATAVPKEDWTTVHPILGDTKVRQAVAYCTDRDSLIKASFPALPDADRAKLRMDTFIVKDSPFYAKDNANLVQYPFDLKKAGELLDVAGWKKGEKDKFRKNDKGQQLTLRFYTTNAQFRQTWGTVWTRQMEACGVEIQPFYTPVALSSNLRNRDFDVIGFAWVGQPEPPGVTLYACDQIPRPPKVTAGQNTMGWCNEKASNAIKAGNNTLSLDERKKQYAIAQEEFTKDMPSLPLFQRAETGGFNKNLKGVKFNTTEYYTVGSEKWEIPGKDTAVLAFTQEPDTMFGLVTSLAVQRNAGRLLGYSVTQYDYGFQPVGYADNKFPTIENGGAKLSEVTVKEGDALVDANGNLVTVKGGKLVDEKGAEVKPQQVKNAKFEVVDFKADSKIPQLSITVKGKADKWSDGQPVKRADAELGYKVTCAKDSGSVSYFTCDRTAKFEAVDDTTQIITYVPGYTPPTYYLAGFGSYPSHQEIKSEGPYKGKKLADVATKDFKSLPEIAETPLGTGPFILSKWEKGKSMTFDVNPNYIGDKPKLKRIIIQFFGDTNAAVAALLQGTVDIVGSETLGGGSEAEVVLKAAKEGKIAAESLASATWEHIDFNLNVK